MSIFIKNIILQLIDTGIDNEMGVLEQKFVRLTNGVALITTFILLFFNPYLLIFLPQTKLLFINNLISIFTFPIVLLFNYYKHYLLAKLFMAYYAILGIIIFSVLLGGEANFHFYSLFLIIVTSFIHPIYEKTYQYLVMFSAATTFVGLEIWFSNHSSLLDLSTRIIYLSRTHNNIGMLLFILSFITYIAWNYKIAESNLEEEKKKSEQLLHNILPIPIAKRLKEEVRIIADGFEETTILFADIVGFTPLSEKLEPNNLVSLLNDVFSQFDYMVHKHDLEKIKTIGDAYMVAAGIPIPKDNHMETVAELAIEMKNSLENFNNPIQQSLNIRIGIHSGPVIAGVIGVKKFIYDVWGDTVNTASRMESHGVPGKIQVTDIIYYKLKEKYSFLERGLIDIKGKGKMKTYFLEGRK